ncbi:ATP-binding protein [Streptomyces lucensis]|uniref:ATP-binding protein n=1 Tax=Streptomyces lucensis TaxID=67319 RepID=UPI003570E1B9
MNVSTTARTTSVPRLRGSWAPDAAPIRTTVALDGNAGCIAEARRRAAGFLTRARDGHGLPVSARALDLTQLVVSELVTNACKYAPGPVLVDMLITGGLVELSVSDGDPALPVARAAEPGRVGQHGLEIVMAVVREFEARRTPLGKRITVRVSLDDDDSGAAGSLRPGGTP